MKLSKSQKEEIEHEVKKQFSRLNYYQEEKIAKRWRLVWSVVLLIASFCLGIALYSLTNNPVAFLSFGVIGWILYKIASSLPTEKCVKFYLRLCIKEDYKNYLKTGNIDYKTKDYSKIYPKGDSKNVGDYSTTNYSVPRSSYTPTSSKIDDMDDLEFDEMNDIWDEDDDIDDEDDDGYLF